MTVSQEFQITLDAAGQRANALVELAAEKGIPFSFCITSVVKHGGLPSLADLQLMAVRLRPLFSRSATEHAFRLDNVEEFSNFVTTFSGKVASEFDKIFTKLVDDRPYVLPADLISYISDPHTGVVFTSPADEAANKQALERPDFPAAFTFVGQFIDHDLTLNAVNLIDPEGDDVENKASPYIDLDSVYGLRSALAKKPEAIFVGDPAKAKFKHDNTTGVLDLARSPVADGAEWVNAPAIFDARNDENQMILQVHILLERLHYKFVDNGLDFDTARKHTLLNWQSFVLTEYLPNLIMPDVLTTLRGYIDAGNFAQLKVAKQSAAGEWYIKMPHEFSVGFRMGHSQLRPGYVVQNGAPPVPLFQADLKPDAGSFPPPLSPICEAVRS